MRNILATARPNKDYRWIKCLQEYILEARRSGDQIRYYTVANGQEKCLTKETILSLFSLGSRVKDQPFRATENKEFYKLLKSKS